MFQPKQLLLNFAISFCSALATWNPPFYSQNDPRWGSEILGFGPATITQAGCCMTSITMLVAGFNVTINDTIPDPSIMNQWLIKP